MSDKVNHPSHYTDYPIEVIDMIREILTETYGEEAFEAYCLGNEVKYRMRAGLKGVGDEDIKKAMKYKEFRQKEEAEDEEISLEDCYKPWDSEDDLGYGRQIHAECSFGVSPKDIAREKMRSYLENQEGILTCYFDYPTDYIKGWIDLLTEEQQRPDELDRKGIPEHKRHLYK